MYQKKLYNYNFPKNVLLILDRLNKNGEGFLVGGCVRDILSNIEPEDFDFVTNIDYKNLLNIFKDFKVKEIGATFGIIQVTIENESYEIAKYRIDSKQSDGRRPCSVMYTNDILEDLKRRDFTINGMAFNFKRGLIDPFNAVEDIENHKLKFIGNANERIKEDGLRILRAFRFQATKNFDIEKKDLDEIYKNRDMLNKISHERISQEFSKILLGNFKKTFYDMKESAILEKIIPEIKDTYDYNQNSKYHKYNLFEHIIKVMENVPTNLELRYAALFHDLGKPSSKILGTDGYNHYYNHEVISAEIAEKRLKDLKFSRKFIEEIKNLCLEHMRFNGSKSEKTIKKIISKYGENFCEKLIDLSIADNAAKADNIKDEDGKKILLENFEKIISKSKVPNINTLAIKGEDLINLGYSGKEIGKLKNSLLDLILNDILENERNILLEAVKNNKIKI
ncbi:MAG: CCA tRNA nucleotidyltransferase [Fusobacteriaceae bacterium]|nr:CCA tRNA nucleotidyltransferase [Fusobacteriaceae bacterium]